MSYRLQIACAWCGPLMTLGFFVGLLLFAGFIPPPSPADSAAEIAQMFRHNTTGIRVGLFIAMLATGLLCPFYAAIAVQMKRIEGRWSPLTYTQIIAGACSTMEIVLPMMIWQAAAFRPERDDEFIRTLGVVASGEFHGIAGIPQAFEMDALHHANAVRIEAGNNAASQRHPTFPALA